MARAPKVPGPHVHFLSIAQASLLAGLDRTTVKRMVDRGTLQSFTLPGDVRWRRIPRRAVLALRRELDRLAEEGR